MILQMRLLQHVVVSELLKGNENFSLPLKHVTLTHSKKNHQLATIKITPVDGVGNSL